MAMTAVGARDQVVPAERRHHTRGHRFLADVDVNETRHPSGTKDLARFQLKFSYFHHSAI
jgi:hypothetical protein